MTYLLYGINIYLPVSVPLVCFDTFVSELQHLIQYFIQLITNQDYFF